MSKLETEGKAAGGFLNGAVPPTHATNSYVVGSSNADPVTEPVADAESGPVAPPRGGAGSGIDEWRTYAVDVLGLDVDDDATRDDIIAAVDEHTAKV